MLQIPKSEPTAKSPSLFSAWLKGLIQRRKVDAVGQESAIITLASRSLRTFPVTSSNISTTNMSHGHLASAPGTESAVDTKKTFSSRTLDYANVFGTAAIPFVEAIPVIGTPLKAAIGGLLGILTIIDVSAKS